MIEITNQTSLIESDVEKFIKALKPEYAGITYMLSSDNDKGRLQIPVFNDRVFDFNETDNWTTIITYCLNNNLFNKYIDLKAETLSGFSKITHAEDLMNVNINPDLIVVCFPRIQEKTKSGLIKDKATLEKEELDALGKPFLVINIGSKAKVMTNLNIGDKIILKNTAQPIYRNVVLNAFEEEVGIFIVYCHDFLIQVK